jgi:hypothetical protein
MNAAAVICGHVTLVYDTMKSDKKAASTMTR